MFQDVKGKEVQKQAFATFDITPPENIMMDFDFENRVVIMKNKKTQQMIILFGSEHNCEQSISFGKQLIDTFKPKTIFLEEQPLEEKVQETYTDDKTGVTYPGYNKLLDRLSELEMRVFVEQSILRNTHDYQVD